MKLIFEALGRGATVVTGSNRLARHVKWRFDRQCHGQGSSAWTSADVIPWQSWLERLWEDSFLHQGLAGQYDLLSDYQARLLWRDCIGVDDLVLNRHATARLAAQAWQLCGEWQISLDEIQQTAASADAAAFCSYARRYSEFCLSNRFMDAGGVSNLIVRDLQAGAIRAASEIVFIGFETLSVKQRQLLEALKKAGSRVAVLQAPNPNPLPAGEVVACANPQEEIECIAHWSRRLLEQEHTDVVGVLTANSDQYGDSLRRGLLDLLMPDWRSEPGGVHPVNNAAGVRLADTGPVHIALLLLKGIRGHLDYRELGQLLRTRFLRGRNEEMYARDRLDIRIREQGQRDVELGWAANTARVKAPLFAIVLESLANAKSRLSDQREPSGWAATLNGLLTELGWPGDQQPGSDEYQNILAWHRLLESFAGANRLLGNIGLFDAVRNIDTLAREQLFQPEGRMDGIQIMTLRQAIDHQFDAIWVCGMSAEAWPPPVRPNPLIPLQLQRRAGIPAASPEGSDLLAGRILGGLGAPPEKRIYSWSAQKDQEELLPSPALGQLKAAAGKPEKHSLAQTYRDRVLESQVLEQLPVDPAPALAADENVHGGSQVLRLQSQSPAIAFFQCRLGAAELPVPAFGINPLTRGNITHDALEALYLNFSDRHSIQDRPSPELSVLADRAAAQAVGKHLSVHHPLIGPLARIERVRVTGHLMQLLELEKTRDEFTIESLEGQLQVVIGPLTLKVRHDRVDRLPDGSRLILDYKTGYSYTISDWKGERPSDPQLLLYATTTDDVHGIAVVLLNHEGVRFTGVGERNFGLAGITEPAKFVRDDSASWDQLITTWRKTLSALAAEFAGGDCRFDSNNLELLRGDFAMLARIYDAGAVEILD